MAVDCGISIGAKISEYLVEPLLIRPLCPIFCFGSIVGDFQGQHTKLSAIQERVENDVQRDRDNAQVIYKSVESWVKDVNDVMPKAQRMLDELSANSKSCFRYSWCPNWTCHYSFSKKVSQITVTMKTLCANGDLFTSVSHPMKLLDVIRDTVLWIGGTESQERIVLTVRDNEDLKGLIKKKSFQSCKAVSIMPEAIRKLSKHNKLECPVLETVLIFSKEEDVMLREGFFEDMQHLKVLFIKGSGWRRSWCKFTSPQSLRTLMLRYCRFSNNCILRELRKLKILSLNGCEYDGGVEILSGLKKLRLLDVNGLRAETRMFSSNEVERFSKLEELHGYTVPKCKGEEGTSNILSELMLLSKLVVLSVQIEDASRLPTSFCFPNVQNYYILWGRNEGSRFERWSEDAEESRSLELICNNGDESVWIGACKKLLPTVQDLFFQSCDNLRSLDAFNSHAEGFLQRLRSLEVESCAIMKWMFEFQVNQNVIKLQFLKILKLRNLSQLKHMWKGPTRLVTLCNLTRVEISDCTELISIFSSPSLATSMQQLEILKISWCPDLEEIISSKGGGDDDDDDFGCCCCFTNLRELEVTNCGKVKTIFPIVKSTGRASRRHPQSGCRLPKLHWIVLVSNYELENIFGQQSQAEEGVRVECPSLQVLRVMHCFLSTTHFAASQLQEDPSPQPLKVDSADNIQGLEQIRHGDLSQSTIVCSSILKRVELKGCCNLKQAFTTSLVSSLCQLEELIVEECYELEQVISKAGDEKEPTIIVCFEKLRTLKVNRCKKLKTIFPITVALPKLEWLELNSNAEMEHVFGQSDGDYNWPLPFLEDIWVVGCPKLSTQFSAAIIQNMSIAKVENITLDDIKGAEAIMRIEKQQDNDIDELIVTCQLFSMILRNLVDLKCIWRCPKQNIFFVSLYRLEVIGCNKLKHLLEITTLPKLMHLTVERCNELEQVFVMAENGIEKNGDANGVGFRELRTLKVSECEKLKTVFTISIALPKLESLQLKSNEELEHVFGQSDWDYVWQSAVMKDLCVVDCPKMCIQWMQNLSTAKKEMETTQVVEESDLTEREGVGVTWIF